MAKIELKGTITTVLPVETVGANGTKKQSLIFTEPAYRDEYGDIKGKDKHWKIDVIGENVDKFRLNASLNGKRAKIEAWVNSEVYTKDGKDTYFINANLKSYELAPTNAQPVTTAADGDDLPF